MQFKQWQIKEDQFGLKQFWLKNGDSGSKRGFVTVTVLQNNWWDFILTFFYEEILEFSIVKWTYSGLE